MSEALPVYIGFDPREADAYAVCEHSLLRHASIPLNIVKLDREKLWKDGIFDRPFRKNGTQMIDVKDGRPFSTEFSFTRFLVPYLNNYEGVSVFCDCDFLFTDDIAKAFDCLDPQMAIHVVQHKQQISESVKMDGVSQAAYMRKNWSSFVVWNAGHPSNKLLTKDVVNNRSGRWLHGFWWLADSEIGSLSLDWNYLADVSPPWEGDLPPKAIHYTLGVPSMKGYEHCQFSELWTSEYSRTRQAGNADSINVAA